MNCKGAEKEMGGLKKILFLTGYPAPYRVLFFDELGKDTDLTVLFADRKEDQSHRSRQWFVESQGHFRWVQLEKRQLHTRGGDLCPGVISWLKKPWDHIVVCGYSSPTVMLAMAWLRLHRIPFYMEIDGGLVRPDSRLKYRFKRLLVSAPAYWISSGEPSTEYLTYYGAKRERVATYPFTSLYARDIPREIPAPEEKAALRRELGMGSGKILLSVGRFDRGKGFDVLLKAMARVKEPSQLYLVGGEPTEEYLALTEELGLSNVHFVGFRPKEELKKYYQAADAFVLPTRSDVWGLVINEAMACGLPVVTTTRCVAGLTLIRDGVNGYLVPIDEEEKLAEKLDAVLAGDCREMGRSALETIRPYTIENMARAHVELFAHQTGGKP